MDCFGRWLVVCTDVWKLWEMMCLFSWEMSIPSNLG